MNIYQSFKTIKKNNADNMADFFENNETAAAALVQKINDAKSEKEIGSMTSGVFDLVSIMQNIRAIDSGTYIRLTGRFLRSHGKYNFPTLYNMAMIMDNNLKLAYVRDNWEKIAEKNPKAFKALNSAYEDIKKRASDYALRGFYCELQCDFVLSWTNGKPTYRHERVCDFYSHPDKAQTPIDSNPELIKWALLKLYEGYFITFSLLAYSYKTKSSEVLTLGYQFGILYEMVNSFGGHAITCLLPDLGADVHQIAGDRYLALCCPKEAKAGYVRCADAQSPIFEA